MQSEQLIGTRVSETLRTSIVVTSSGHVVKMRYETTQRRLTDSSSAGQGTTLRSGMGTVNGTETAYKGIRVTSATAAVSTSLPVRSPMGGITAVAVDGITAVSAAIHVRP